MTMLQKMAEAIANAASEATLHEPGRGLSLEEATAVARAALQAMREPNDAAIDAAREWVNFHDLMDKMGEREDIRFAVRRMVDAILDGRA